MPATCGASGSTQGYCIDEAGEPVQLVPSIEVQFEGTTLSTELFRFEVGSGIRNDELQTYTESPDNVFYEDGELVLEALFDEETGEYTSGSVELLEPVTFGRIEASIRSDVGAGAKPSFWLLPDDPGGPQTVCVDGSECVTSHWPAWGGIVVLSGRADSSSLATISFAEESGDALNLAEYVQSADVGPTMSTEFHLYAIEWGPERVDWFVDDRLVYSFDLTSDEIYQPGGEHPFHQAFRVKLNLAVGGLVEEPDPGQYPRQMRVRSLRVLSYE